jgi:DNA-binding MarR family transcriptional regulator
MAERLGLADYRALAEFRYQIRRFLSFSETAARAAGIEPQQHQLLLALKGLPAGRRPNVGALADRLCVKHHTAVALIDHLVARRLVRRQPGTVDRREVIVLLTRTGEALLRRLSALHRKQLESVGTDLAQALQEIISGRAEARA